jgi:superoxide dismutase, Fe-Mn family
MTQFTLPPLPYGKDALSPHLSAETLDFHYGKHHQAYVDNLNKLVSGTKFQNKELVEIVKKSSGAIFNNAAQDWNHSFYWKSLSEEKNQSPKGSLSGAIDQNFGSYAEFEKQFSAAAIAQFGSGWAWLTVNKAGKKLKIETTSNAENPIHTGSGIPLFTMDVWEHAYYIDYRNARAKYVENFFKVLNWNFAEGNFNQVVGSAAPNVKASKTVPSNGKGSKLKLVKR